MFGFGALGRGRRRRARRTNEGTSAIALFLHVHFECRARRTLSRKQQHTLPRGTVTTTLRCVHSSARTSAVQLEPESHRRRGSYKSQCRYFRCLSERIHTCRRHPCVCFYSKRAVTCEIIMHLNDAANMTLTAVDVLRFNEETEICSVRAYKL